MKSLLNGFVTSRLRGAQAMNGCTRRPDQATPLLGKSHPGLFRAQSQEQKKEHQVYCLTFYFQLAQVYIYTYVCVCMLLHHRGNVSSLVLLVGKLERVLFSKPSHDQNTTIQVVPGQAGGGSFL